MLIDAKRAVQQENLDISIKRGGFHMVSSMTKKIISLAISLLVVVISLTDVALGATAPTVSTLSRYTPGFVGGPGKMARDGAGNFYVTDFWGKQIVKLDRNGAKIGTVATAGRPSAVAVMPDNRLVVAMVLPQPYIAFYSQVLTGSGSNKTLSGEELSRFGTTGGSPAYVPLYRPAGITIDAAGYIYVLDAGDSKNSGVFWGKVRVYDSAGVYLHEFGSRTFTYEISTAGGYFRQPAGIAYEAIGNRVVVADTMNSRLQFFGAYSAGTCAYLGSVGNTRFDNPADYVLGSSPVKLGDPTDVAFEYSGGSLFRMYVAERGRNEISVVNMQGATPGTGNPSCSACTDLKRINGSTVADADMKYPSGVIFEKTSVGGVLYTNSASISTAANSFLALSIDSGSVPVPNSLAITSTVSATSTSATLPLSGTVSPLADVFCGVNGVWNSVKAGGASSWNDSVTLPKTGYNYILCKSTSGGVTTFAEASTYYNPDTVPTPIVSISQPVAGLVTKNTAVTVSGTSDAPNATVRVVNGNGGATVYTMTNAAGNWSAPITLPATDGGNLITVSVWKAGTGTGEATRTINYDGTGPTIAISFLGDGATTNNAVQNIDGVVADPNLDPESIKVNGVAVSVDEKVTLADNSTYFSFPVTLVRKSNDITVTAADLVGNITTVSRTVTLNPEKPGFTVTLPADNSYLSSTGSVPAEGTAENGFDLVNANAVSGNAWSGTLSAQSGFQQYLFVATGSNTSVSAKRTIISDAAYVQLAITNPPADLATRGTLDGSVYLPYIDVTGNVAEGTAAAPTISVSNSAVISNSTYVQGTGAFSFRVTFTAQGTCSIKVTSGTTTVVRNIIYDSISPNVTIQADSKPTPAVITAVMDSSDKISGITAALNGSPVSIPLSVITFDDPAAGSVVWQANLSGYAYSSITFNVTDPAGNQKNANICVVQAHPGDIDNDGVVRLSDALAALRHVAGTQLLGEEEFKRADVGELVNGRTGCDGVVDITDSVLILSKSYGLTTF